MNEANEERGELTLELGGKAYQLRPSYAAMKAIETKLGPLIALSYRHANPREALTVHEMAVIAAEAIRAAAVEQKDSILRDVKAERIAELIVDTGVLAVMPTIGDLLKNMITGGAKPKKAMPAATAEPTQATSESNIAG